MAVEEFLTQVFIESLPLSVLCYPVVLILDLILNWPSHRVTQKWDIVHDPIREH